MDLYQGILSRRSIRKFKNQKIEREILEKIIAAAQYAPSAHNKQPWEFLVIEDKEKLASLRLVQRWTSFAKDAACAVIVCGNLNQTFSRDKDDEKWDYADIDCALASQNLMLAAHSFGVGSCFCGASPMPLVISGLREHFNLPEHIRPLSIIIMGYPDETPPEPQNRFDENKIHWENW
ncbi:MAG: nitroreductase family protein [Alphaproteobacteria bacterium]|nr:nitroreductase family protein [Alphaproteobacteria bacterium]